MPTFRPYTTEELRSAAQAYGIDPDFVEAVYAVESSRGTNPQAMVARTVKRKRDSTIVRGPFQLEDGTASDIIRKNKLGNVNVDDPDVHLDLALRLMQDLKKRYDGDYGKMAQAYLGFGTDELGTTDKAYRNRIMTEMASLRSARGDEALGVPAQDYSRFTADNMDRMLAPEILTPFQHGADASSASDEMLGIPSRMAAVPATQGTRWADLLAANRSGGGNQFALPDAGAFPDPTMESDVLSYVQQLVDEELAGKDFAHA